MHSQIHQLLLSRGQDIVLYCPCYRIVFVRRGKLKISTQDNSLQISKGEMILLSPKTTYKLHANSIVRILTVEWNFEINLRKYFRIDFSAIAQKETVNTNTCTYILKANNVIDLFLKNTESYLTDVKTPKLFEVKTEELFVLMNANYDEKELYHFFYHPLGGNMSFSDMVNKNATKAKTVKELASSCKYSNNNIFSKHFFSTFSTTPSVWLKTKRAEIIKNDLMYSGMSYKEICEKYNFSSYTELRNYCRKEYNKLPNRLQATYTYSNLKKV